MGDHQDSDDYVELKIGREIYNDFIEYLLVLSYSPRIFNEKNPGIRAKVSELEHLKTIENEEDRNKTFVKFEMTMEYYTFLIGIMDRGVELGMKMIAHSMGLRKGGD